MMAIRNCSLLKRVLFLLALSSPAHAFDEWSDADKSRQSAAVLLLVADWGQTLDGINRPDFYESNPILGAHPTRGDVNRYFATSVIGHTVIAHVLPAEWRAPWQLLIITLETVVVANNFRIGLRISF